MPSLTQWAGFSLANLRPMTTTFITAPSCATPADPALVIGHDTLSLEMAAPSCPEEIPPTFPEGCWPSAREANALETALKGGILGLVCPAGWTTAGTVARPTTTGANAAGVYADGDYSQLGEETEYRAPDQALTHALEPGKTMTLCCPSGYQGEPWAGFCRSSVGVATDMGISTVCFYHRSGPEAAPTPVRVDINNNIFTAMAFSFVEAVTLVHGPSDSAGGPPDPTGTAAPAATGVSVGGAGPTETPSAGTRSILGHREPLLLVGGFVAALAGSMLII